MSQRYIFSQVMRTVNRYQFNMCVSRYTGNKHVRTLTCWEQFLAMAFGQLAMRESLRDVVVCLQAHNDILYRLGFRGSVFLPTLARANEQRDWRIYGDFARLLIPHVQQLYQHDMPLDLEGSVYVVDSTTIELCMSMFPWALLKKQRAAIKLHMSMDLAGNIPSFFDFSSAARSDMEFMDRLDFLPGAYYVFDRGYMDFERLYAIHQRGALFVIRAKDNLKFVRRYSGKVDRSTGVICDQIGVLSGVQTKSKYPDILRRVRYMDIQTRQTYVYLTNAMDIDAQTVALLYKHRWQVELFFKWLKQHLRVRRFWGYSENAVKTQICIAICSYLLVAIMKKQLGIERSLYEMLQILSVSLFERSDLTELISEFKLQTSELGDEKQATLWDI